MRNRYRILARKSPDIISLCRSRREWEAVGEHRVVNGSTGVLPDISWMRCVFHMTQFPFTSYGSDQGPGWIHRSTSRLTTELPVRSRLTMKQRATECGSSVCRSCNACLRDLVGKGIFVSHSRIILNWILEIACEDWRYAQGIAHGDYTVLNVHNNLPDVSFVVVMCICLCVLFVVPYCINTATGFTIHLQSNNNNNHHHHHHRSQLK
jgi:hypothetical protein